MEHSEEPLSETPEDVAILYSWANLHGAKYRDFSASRREYRAQMRHRAAEELRRAELAAKAQAEAAAAEAERAAREAEQAARAADRSDSSSDRENALRTAEDAGRRAGAERVEAARRAEAAAMAEAVARREEREIAEAHASAERQAKSYGQSEIRRRYLAGPQPQPPGVTTDPYGYVHSDVPFIEHNSASSALPRREDLISGIRSREEMARVQQSSGDRRAYRPELEVRRRPQGYRPDEASGMRAAFRPPVAYTAPQPVRHRINNARDGLGFPQGDPYSAPTQGTPAQPAAALPNRYQPHAGASPVPLLDHFANPYAAAQSVPAHVADQPGPAWLYSANPVPRPAAQPQRIPAADTLQQQSEHVAARWFALKGAFEPGQESVAEVPVEARPDLQTPLVAVFSLAGGVGKTSLVATLGRALSSLGEKVLLADTTSHGLLPYYFGASELKVGVVRTFSAPSGSNDATIYLVSYAAEQGAGDPARQDGIVGELVSKAGGTNRVVLDLNASSGWMVRRLAQANPIVLVPVSPDMNSVISLQTVERYFGGVNDAEGQPILPHYVFNQFDTTLPLHLDVREVLRRQLGDRLLPFVLRRAPAVSEALAEGMTVVDYAPKAPITEDYMQVANWLRKLSPPAAQAPRNARWSER